MIEYDCYRSLVYNQTLMVSVVTTKPQTLNPKPYTLNPKP